AIRETLDLLLRTFPIRTCSDNKFAHHERLGRPCLLFHIEKCKGPCVGEVDEAEYSRLIEQLIEFLDGDTQSVVHQLECQMREAADVQEYERAARLRDRLASVRKAIEKQTIVTEKPEDLDVIGMSGDELEVAVQVFFVRRGRVVGRKGFILDLVEDVSPGELVGRVLEGLYAEAEPEAIPHQVLVPDEPADADVYREFLCEVRGSNVSIRVPQRGDKRALQATVTQNAKEEFVRHRLRRASDHNARARALTALQDALGLPDAPLRIECFDMSHIQGSDYVGSMVVMEDGLPKKSDYRRFRIKEVPGNDDFAAMEEVLTRRLTALIAERDRSLGAGLGEGSSRPRKFAYPPNLLVVDGGRGQLNVAQRVVESLGLEEEIAVAGLAKRFEEVYVPGQADPIRIARQSEALYMLQRLRDEAHRFAIAYHRQLRGKRMTTSVLDGIKGLGETRRKRLVKELGGIKAVKEASLDDLLALRWLPDTVGRAVYEKVHGPASGQPVTISGAIAPESVTSSDSGTGDG
ncbi:MAG TPA: excinuclease ABC subunit UvrC, partial [Acidimicrobiales bacterium]|nr:excinuclease ABC subunit UvrC [Acidimicrobiales bacterium]